MKHEVTAADELAVLERAMKRKRPRQPETDGADTWEPGGGGLPENAQPTT